MPAYVELQEREFAAEVRRLHRRQAPARGRHRLLRPDQHGAQPGRRDHRRCAARPRRRSSHERASASESEGSAPLVPHGVAERSEVAHGIEILADGDDREISTRRPRLPGRAGLPSSPGAAWRCLTPAAPAVPGTRPASCRASCRRRRRSARTTPGGSPPPAPGLVDRRVEITGPTDRKMTVNALNSGAQVWLADFEDATSPTWANIIGGQLNLLDAAASADRLHRRARASATRSAPRTGPDHRRAARAAGTWRRSTSSSTAGPISASLVDFGLYFSTVRQLQVDAGARARTSTCRSWRATSRRGCGTTSSCSRSSTSACRRAPSGRPC